MSLNPLRNLPSVNELLESPPLRALIRGLSRNVVVNAVRAVLDETRAEVQTAAAEKTLPNVADLAERIARRVMESEAPGLRPVINATGLVWHPDLGYPPLAEEALAAMADVARDYAGVEFDLAAGKRSRRSLAVEPLWKELTGAEAALAVNNDAGATLLSLAALAAGREVIVSRGQLLEIGGGFRLPDVLAASGAILREVGTTNKTRIGDYAQAIGAQTAALLLVPAGGIVMPEFCESVDLPVLVDLGQRHKLPVLHGVGSGAMIDFTPFGLPGEPLVKQSLQQGADLVLVSGQRLLGGPPCGIILGRKALVEKIERHPLARALRADKITLAALAATLRLYRDPEKAVHAVPALQLLTTPEENLRHRAERLAPQIAALKKIAAAAQPVPDASNPGGREIPASKLPTWCIAVTPAGLSGDRLAAALRLATPPVVGRVRDGRLLLDLRSVFPRQDLELVQAFESLARE